MRKSSSKAKEFRTTKTGHLQEKKPQSDLKPTKLGAGLGPIGSGRVSLSRIPAAAWKRSEQELIKLENRLELKS